MATNKPLMSERRVSIIGGCLAMIGPFSMAVYTPAMTEIVTAFDTTPAAVKMSLSLYFAGFAFAQLICGPLSDGLGRRPVTIAFMVIYTVASLMAVFAPDIQWLIAARLLQGVGAAVGIAVSRAIVRDTFNHDQAARIMNLIATILVIAPALAPTIGGLTMEFFGWHAIFIVMAIFGNVLMLIALFGMRETVDIDPSRIKPKALAQSYAALLGSRYFVSAGLTNAFSTGMLYALATMLPFVMMTRAGLSPTEFGAAMIIQSLSFFSGTIAVRVLMHRHSATSLVPLGLSAIAVACVGLVTLPHLFGPSIYTVMLPVGLIAFGIAFIVSSMTMAALGPFPRNAGAASALVGFLQMGGGMAGGIVATLFDDPVFALSTIIPTMGLLAIISWLIWRRLPEPAEFVPVTEETNVSI